jgi:hypothetical protein
MRPKQIPYGISNFEKIRRENYAYVDKTRFIEMIENDPTEYAFLIRPRRFGKSLFLAMLTCYYDLKYANDFDLLFGGLHIGNNPTPKHNSYFVLRFNFSGINTNSVDEFTKSFTASIKSNIDTFLIEHKEIIKDYKAQRLYLRTLTEIKSCLEFALSFAKDLDKKAFVIIDEYDHFANDLIEQGTDPGDEKYKKLIWANSVVRDFYETLKTATETVVDKILITGVTPIMLDDVTSGFNISNNISLDTRYNEILGFTEDEVHWLIEVCGVNKDDATKVDRKLLYDGYSFSTRGTNTLYNSTMILYFLYHTQISDGRVDKLIDENIKTDYGKLQNLFDRVENVDKIEELLNAESVPSGVTGQFSIEEMGSIENFLSLLYYMGLVTLAKDEDTGASLLRIPNLSVKTMYWEYIRKILQNHIRGLSVNTIKMERSIRQLAFANEPESFIKFIQEDYLSLFSNRDYRRFDEKYIKAVMLTLLFQSNFYLPVSEQENNNGYSDIYLQRRSELYPKITTDWIFELKYVKEEDSKNENLISKQFIQSKKQIFDYKSSVRYKDRKDIRYLAVVFIGKRDYLIEEVK